MALNELLTNAFKHAYPAGRPGRILVALAADPDRLELSVADDGCGMAQGSQEGLGLLLVRTLATQLEGEIDYKQNHGTQATIRVPR